MKLPILFIGASILFWGIESGFLLLAIPMAFLVESANFTSRKFTLKEADFVRISDFTSIIFIASTALIILNYETLFFLKGVVQWQPLVVLPLILAQLYSTSDTIIIGTQIGFRRKKAYVHRPLDFRFFYCGLCVFAAAVCNSRSPFFYPSVLFLFSWLLLFNREKAFPQYQFILLISLASGLGFFGYLAGEKGHDLLSYKMGQFIRNYYWSKYADPYQNYLSFGSIKRYKGSSQIILRVSKDTPQPLLLRQASYDTYVTQRWINNQTFTFIPVTEDVWKLLPEPENRGENVEIELYLPREQGLMPAPKGSYSVTGDQLFELSKSPAGILKILDAASLLSYSILYDTNHGDTQDLPSYTHLIVPREEEYVIGDIAEKLQLQSLSPMKQIQRLTSFFEKEFSYSLSVEQSYSSATALGSFLLENRSGYCEMFATATALLLRKGGVPSRYVTGFVAEEFSTLEKKIIVRKRHAHAWVEAYVQGKWIEIDTTPPSWLEIDRHEGSFFEPVMDLFGYLKLHYDRFRIQAEQRYRLLLSVVIILLTLFLAYRIYRRIQAQTELSSLPAERRIFTEETPFTRIEKILTEYGLPREDGEPFFHWIDRAKFSDIQELGSLRKLYFLHQKYRFDPRKLSEKEFTYLEQEVELWLHTYQQRRRGES